MEALIALAICFAFAYACAGLLEKVPVAFYVAFIVVGALFASGVLEASVSALYRALIPYTRRASLAFGLFTIVMFVGALSPDSALRRRLSPVRGQLSIIGFILVCVHVVGYAATYWATMSGGVASPAIMFGLMVGIASAVLLVILSVTSITAVRKALDARWWKRIQKLAYPFYLLMYAHLAAMLAPSSLAGGNSRANLIVYSALFAAYLVARTVRFARERGRKRPMPGEGPVG